MSLGKMGSVSTPSTAIKGKRKFLTEINLAEIVCIQVPCLETSHTIHMYMMYLFYNQRLSM
jgi:hypothetical protein